MKVIVVGATGGTGKYVVSMLLDQGQDVVAYVRNPDKLGIEHSKLSVIKGDIYSLEDLTKAFEGGEGVISCLGSSTTKPSDELEMMATVISQAMKATGIKRIVYMSTAGIESEFKGPMKWLIHSMIGNVIKDHRNAAEVYKSGAFDYTIARPMQLGTGEPTYKYMTADQGLPKSRKAVSRANVADFLVKSMLNGENINKSVALAE